MEKGQRNQDIQLTRQLANDYDRWIELVRKYQSDAQIELWKIYKQISFVPGLFCDIMLCPITGINGSYISNVNILQSPAFVYIYTIQGILYYYNFATAKSETWPMVKTLWPWTAEALPLPDLPADVWGCIFQHLSIDDTLELAYVCKQWKAHVRAERHWNWRVAALHKIVPRECLPQVFSNEPWRYFSYLRYIYNDNMSNMTQSTRNRVFLIIVRLK
jgi:hypothetical protein